MKISDRLSQRPLREMRVTLVWLPSRDSAGRARKAYWKASKRLPDEGRRDAIARIPPGVRLNSLLEEVEACVVGFSGVVLMTTLDKVTKGREF